MTARKRKYSALYRYIEALQRDRPWGIVLDAGTGVNSIRWLSGLPTDRWTAVTGSNAEARLTNEALGSEMRSGDRIILGNWADNQFLKGEVYDTVVADYLLGAVEGFSPYYQSYLFSRLRPLTAKTLYVTGLEPYVPTMRPKTNAGAIVWEIGRFRDACVLMKGSMPYREYPLPWVVDKLRQSGFEVRKTKHFDIRFKELFVNAQINIAISGLEKLPDQTLAQALKRRAEVLRGQALDIIDEQGALDTCSNYVIEAKPI